MFLPDVEQTPKSGWYASAIAQKQQEGVEYPQIWHLFAYLPSATDHLARFTWAMQAVVHQLVNPRARSWLLAAGAVVGVAAP